MYYVSNEQFRNHILNLAERAAQPDITHKLFKSQVIYYPSLSTQQAIVTHLDTLSAKVTQLQQNFEKIKVECDALKQALLQQVFE